jgi:hypothetical protein
VTAAEAHRLALGQTIDNRWGRVEPEFAAVGEQQELVAIVVPVGEHTLRASKGFARAESFN